MVSQTVSSVMIIITEWSKDSNTRLTPHMRDVFAVPSGHVLTKLELHVLSDMLASYSNEKIKEIQQSIQNKERINISREEIERSLREGGMTAVADELERNLLKGTTLIATLNDMVSSPDHTSCEEKDLVTLGNPYLLTAHIGFFQIAGLHYLHSLHGSECKRVHAKYCGTCMLRTITLRKS